MIYLDTAALVKLLRPEPATTDLTNWLKARAGMPLVSSVLVEVEIPRAIRQAAPQALAAVPAVVSRLYRYEIDAGIRAAAAYGLATASPGA